LGFGTFFKYISHYFGLITNFLGYIRHGLPPTSTTATNTSQGTNHDTPTPAATDDGSQQHLHLQLHQQPQPQQQQLQRRRGDDAEGRPRRYHRRYVLFVS
jgi:hypothetical protein